MVILEFKKLSEKEIKDYVDELRRLGWCLDCQGYGQDASDGTNCKLCDGSGKEKL